MTENDKKEALTALVIIQVALRMDEKQKAAAVRATERMGVVFFEEKLGIGHVVSVITRFATSIAAEQQWSREQFLAIVGAIYDEARPGADAVYAAHRAKRS